MKGSSYYQLPPIAQWLTGNIGLHHIHHISSLIPNYRLQECLDDNPVLLQVTRLKFWESLRCITLALWDEEKNQLVSFRDLRTRRLPA